MRFSLLLALGGACVPALGFAQSAPRLYLGAGASVVIPGPFQSYATAGVGPGFTIGVQLSPRWAFQTGASIGWSTNNDVINRDSASTTVGAFAFRTRTTQLLVPLLARFTLTAPTSRLHLDLLAGASWLHTSRDRTYRYTDAAQATRNATGGYKLLDNAAYVNLGPALRYDVGSHLAITANALLGLGVLHQNWSQYDTGDRLLLNGQLGVHYTFGK